MIEKIIEKIINDKDKEINDLQQRLDYLEKRNKEIYDGFLAISDERCEYAVIVDKAIEYVKEHRYYAHTIDIDELLKILEGKEE